MSNPTLESKSLDTLRKAQADADSRAKASLREAARDIELAQALQARIQKLSRERAS